MTRDEESVLAMQQASENVKTLKILGASLKSGLDAVARAPLPLTIERLLAELADIEPAEPALAEVAHRGPLRRN